MNERKKEEKERIWKKDKEFAMGKKEWLIEVIIHIRKGKKLW